MAQEAFNYTSSHTPPLVSMLFSTSFDVSFVFLPLASRVLHYLEESIFFPIRYIIYISYTGVFIFLVNSRSISVFALFYFLFLYHLAPTLVFFFFSDCPRLSLGFVCWQRFFPLFFFRCFFFSFLFLFSRGLRGYLPR